MNAKPIVTVTLLAVAALGLSGCGSDDEPSSDPGTTTMSQPTSTAGSSPSADSPTATHDMGGMDDMVMVEIKDFMYKGSMSVEPGQMIMVTNDDAEAHTLTSDDANMFAVTVPGGGTAMFDAPSKAGSYAYHCDFHANMHGSLVVG